MSESNREVLKETQVGKIHLKDLYEIKIKQAADLYPQIDPENDNNPDPKEYAKVVQSIWPISKSLIIANTDNGMRKFNKVIDFFIENGLFKKLDDKEQFMEYVNANPLGRKRKRFEKKSKLPVWEDIYTVFLRVGHLYFSGQKRTVEVSHLD